MAAEREERQMEIDLLRVELKQQTQKTEELAAQFKLAEETCAKKGLEVQQMGQEN
jgi:hypothetical protein